MALYPLYIVRNAQGQYLGTYRAKNAQAAIQRHIDQDRATASTFRKSQPATKWVGLTAALQEPQE